MNTFEELLRKVAGARRAEFDAQADAIFADQHCQAAQAVRLAAEAVLKDHIEARIIAAGQSALSP